MNGFEPPAIVDQLLGQPVKQFGMRGPFTLEAEVARRADDAPAHVVLPEPIDDDSSKELASTGIKIRHPTGQRSPAIGCLPALGRRQ